MTMILDENPRTPAGGYPSLRTVISRTAAAQPPASYEVVHPVQVAHPARVLRDVRLGSGYMSELDDLAPVLSYSWFSDDLYWQARKWVEAIVTLYRTRDLTSDVSARQSVEWLVGAIVRLRREDVDLFHQDRAAQAARHIPGSPAPQRRAWIRDRSWDGKHEYVLQLDPLHWSAEAPVGATNRLVDLSLHAMPDQWWLATYVRRRFTFDPLIFAQYGDWYIKVAEWL